MDAVALVLSLVFAPSVGGSFSCSPAVDMSTVYVDCSNTVGLAKDPPESMFILEICTKARN
jgi:hypothetical protein